MKCFSTFFLFIFSSISLSAGTNGTPVHFNWGSEFNGEVGLRAGYSTGRFQYNLFSPIADGSQYLSTLTWSAQEGPASEIFSRLNHNSGFFVKGTLGGISIGSSTMHDEDSVYAMRGEPYSNTQSTTNNGQSIYTTIDFGYTFMKSDEWELGTFVGYSLYTQRLNAYGCQQMAGGSVCAGSAQMPQSTLVLSQTEKWNSLRFGFVGAGNLTEELKLSAEGAWLPYSYFDGVDSHYQNDNRPVAHQFGSSSSSYQLESTLSYAVTENWKLGATIRYLSLWAVGEEHLPSISQPQNYSSTRLTGLLQISYDFGDPTPARE